MATLLQATVIPSPRHNISDGQNVSIQLDVVPTENHNITSTITDHPVEDGSNISDHARPDPDRLTMECIVSNTPMPPADVDWSRASNAWVSLRLLRDRGSLVTVLTTLQRYENMEIESVSVTRDAPSFNALVFTVAFKQIRIVKNKLTATLVSSRKNVANKTSTGEQIPQPLDDVQTSHVVDAADKTGATKAYQSFTGRGVTSGGG